MKIKYHILLVLFLTYVNVAFAWQSGYTKEQFSGKEETGGQGAMIGAYAAEADYAVAVDVSFAKTPDADANK